MEGRTETNSHGIRVTLCWQECWGSAGCSPSSRQSLPGNKGGICVICQRFVRGLNEMRWCGAISFTPSPTGESSTVIARSHCQSWAFEIKRGHGIDSRYLCDRYLRKSQVLEKRWSPVTGEPGRNHLPQLKAEGDKNTCEVETQMNGSLHSR